MLPDFSSLFVLLGIVCAAGGVGLFGFGIMIIKALRKKKKR